MTTDEQTGPYLRPHQPVTDRHQPGITTAESIALAVLAVPVTAVLVSYVLDLAGAAFSPRVMLVIASVALLGASVTYGRRPLSARSDVWMLVSIVTTIAAWLLWLAWPALLPLSTGPDLTHHLLLIGYIETHWRLVHDPSVEQFLGEMAQYTPGSHVLAALSGAWSGTDGLRSLHPLQSATVALKAGFLYLIGLRLLPPRSPRVLAVVGVALLFGAPRYFLGGFTEYGFLAQVVAELFVVAMWWAMLAWDMAPDMRIGVAFGLAGAAAFLTWPVYTGPPALAFGLLLLTRNDLSWPMRIRHGLAAFVPLGLFSATYLAGRLGWLQIAGTGGAAPWPSVGAFGVPLVVLGLGGLAVAAVRRQGRVTALFVAATAAQILAFYLLASRAGAPEPYMALKMFYLMLWPLAACAVLAVAELWHRVSAASTRHLSTRAESLLAIAVIAGAWALTVRPLWNNPRVLHPRPAAVTAPLYEAGRWARANVPANCLEYLVNDPETAYWLHLAVLGNRRMSPRTGDNSTYELDDALVRWLTPGGRVYAIADLPALPRDVRDELHIIRQFDTAAIAQRVGAGSCEP